MIGRLCGRIVGQEPDGAVLLDVQGVGYELLTPVGAIARAREGSADEPLVLHVHTHIREGSIELFGFASEAERRVFRLLITVPNVGPKTALGALSALPLAELKQAVHDGDVARLSRVPGIGKRTAERLVVELKGKLPPAAGSEVGAARPAQLTDRNAARLLSALTNMGYRASEAERAVKALGDRAKSEPLAQLVREALAWLAR
jgi:Holliday junction DNA helicase RuvA